MLFMTKGKLAISVAAAALLSGPALASEPIWRDIEAGMTLAEVRALYPLNPGSGRKVEHHNRNTELHGFMAIGKCKPRVEILHPQGKVTGVFIWMQDRGILHGMCAEEARAAVLAKFGPPVTQDTKRPQILEADQEDHETLRWVTPTMVVTWRHASISDAWSIEYAATAPADAAEL